MIYNILAIFSDVELVEVESTLNQFTLMNQGTKNQLVKAVEDYRFLVSSLSSVRGLSQQVTLFLLDSKSCTQEGIEEFLDKLEIWIVILEDETEQRIYADILRCWDVFYLDPQEILALRSELIEALVEIQQVKRTRKESKNAQDSFVKNKIPMQSDLKFSYYDSWMMNYGSDFDAPDSSFNIVPNLKRHPSETEISDSFAVYCQKWELPTLSD